MKQQLNALAIEYFPLSFSQDNRNNDDDNNNNNNNNNNNVVTRSLRPNGKPRKTKEERGSRKRRRKKKKVNDDKIDYSKKIDYILQNFEKHYDIGDDNYQNENDIDDNIERLERARWQAWSNYACEVERQRRIKILQEISLEEERERTKRSQWAINAIEKERNERISSQFLSSLCSTSWFEGTVSLYNEDYDLVCPYFKLGCKVSCRRSNLKKHLEECPYTLEPKADDNFIEFDTYEVVCPNSSMGCNYIGIRIDLQHHLIVCPFKGLTREEEEEQRMREREKVILLQEEERNRRVVEDNTGDSFNKTLLLHDLLHTQLQIVITHIHDAIVNYYDNVKKVQNELKGKYENAIEKVRCIIHSLWPFATCEIFGSYATCLYNRLSDIDLVICFADSFQELINNIGSIPFIKVLANHLEREAVDILRINAVHLYCQVPVIKVSYLNEIPIDISINGLHHSGLSSTALTNTIQKSILPFAPICILFKEYLKNKDLNDSYRGGLSSYGLILLILLPMIKKITAHKVSKEISSPITKHNNNKKTSVSRNNNKIIPHITSYNQLASSENIYPSYDKKLPILFPRMDKEIHLIDTWEFVKKQKLKGERVAWLLLGLDEDDFESRYHQKPQ